MQPEPEPPSSRSTVLLEQRGSIAQITLNRPAKLNALNRELQSELSATLTELSADDSISVVILTGAGRAFCAGLDLSDFRGSLTHFQQQSQQESKGCSKERPLDSRVADSVFNRLEAMPQPVIAAVNGAAVTGGFELALACDVIIASPAARFADTHAQLGVMPGAGLSQKLSRLIGLPRAMALSLSGAFLDADAALRCGLLWDLVPPEQLLPAAWELAERMCGAEPQMLRDMKQLIKDGARLPLGEALALERATHENWAARSDMDAVQARRDDVIKRNRAQTGPH